MNRNNRFGAIGAAAIALLLGACGQQQGQQSTAGVERPRKVLFAIVDGIPADVIERVNTPWIDSVAAQGGYVRAFTGGEKDTYSQSPTISAVCYTHFVTGVWTNKHNVWDNGIDSINYRYPSFFWYLKNQYPQKEIGIFSTWQDNRTKLLGEGKDGTDRIKFDFHADGYELDTVTYPHDRASHYIHLIDERVSKDAAEAIRNDAPDLSWVYLQYTDDVGHRHGDSPQMDSAVMVADNQVGRLWQAVRYRQEKFNEDWLVFIVTDHGRDDQGYHHGGQSPRERGIWLATNGSDLNGHFAGPDVAAVDVLPTVMRFLGVEVPRPYRFELDGVPLAGPVSHRFEQAEVVGDSLRVSWKPYRQEGTLKIWLTTTDRHKTGGEDEYVLVGEAAIPDAKATVPIAAHPANFYKVVLESTDNTANRWVGAK